MLTLSGWITTQVPPSSRAAADAKAARTGTAEQAEDPAAGTDAADQHVRLSQAGRELAATMGVPVEEEDEDIDGVHAALAIRARASGQPAVQGCGSR